MAAQSNAPIIIKKVKKVSGDGHHGGAWKVAYADFVTAMMAFFMLMWLLNATTEKQRKGIADYFSPTIPVMRVSGGGDGSFGGDSVFSEETLAQSGTGGLPRSQADSGDGAAQAAETEQLAEIESTLSGSSGESMVGDDAMRHIVTKVTDEGLVIEIFDLENEPLFSADTATPEPIMEELAGMFARVFSLVQNGVAIGGHVKSKPVVMARNESWEVSGERAQVVRELLQGQGLDAARIQRVSGHADREPSSTNPMAARNSRIKLVLLRSDR